MGKFIAFLCVCFAVVGIALAKPQDSNLSKLLSEAVRKVKQEKHATDRDGKFDTRKTEKINYFVDFQQLKDDHLLRELDHLLAERWLTNDLSNKGTSPRTTKEITYPPTTMSETTSTSTSTTQATTTTVLPGPYPENFWRTLLKLWKSRNAFGK